MNILTLAANCRATIKVSQEVDKKIKGSKNCTTQKDGRISHQQHLRGLFIEKNLLFTHFKKMKRHGHVYTLFWSVCLLSEFSYRLMKSVTFSTGTLKYAYKLYTLIPHLYFFFLPILSFLYHKQYQSCIENKKSENLFNCEKKNILQKKVFITKDFCS